MREDHIISGVGKCDFGAAAPLAENKVVEVVKARRRDLPEVVIGNDGVPYWSCAALDWRMIVKTVNRLGRIAMTPQLSAHRRT